jgi:(p)ppGpp synthase/HD superfamily hydrolase
MDEMLNKITKFADHAHGQQRRKYTPERYIVHPIRVMKICKEYTHDPAVLAAALLHDVLEDTGLNKEEIKDFLLQVMEQDAAFQTLQLVEELTDRYIKDKYPKWNRRKRKLKEAARMGNISAESQTIKYADIIDNSLEIIEHDVGFARLYLAESKALLSKMTKGNTTLHQRAMEVVDKCIEKVQISSRLKR